MSNYVTIRQVESKYLGEEKSFKHIDIFNDHHTSSIGFEELGLESDRKFFKSINLLLRFLVKAYKENMGDFAYNELIETMYGNEESVFIDGCWYEWNKIKHIFDGLYEEE